MTVRCKFRLTRVETMAGAKTPDGQTEKLFKLVLLPVTSGSPENAAFYKWTPQGQIELGTINEEAAKAFEFDTDYYVDFTPAPAPTPPA